MAITGVAVTVTLGVWDTANQAWKTGDAGNLTLRLVADGVVSTPSGTVAETDAANLPGQYELALTGAENTGTAMLLGGESSSEDCVVVPAVWHNADAAVSSRLASDDYTAPPSVSAIRTELETPGGMLATAAADVAGLDGDAMYNPAGTGSNTVTVTVQTSGGVVFPSVKVVATNAAETATPLVLWTNSSGQVTFYLDAGAWRFVASGNGAQSGGATNVMVDGAESVTVTVTASTVPAPSSADNFTLYGYETELEDADSPLVGMVVKVTEISGGRVSASGNLIRNLMHRTDTTDANGLWSFDVSRALNGYRIGLLRTVTRADGSTLEETLRATIDTALIVDGFLAFADLSPV